MKISELKQPYRRMAEYLEENAKIQQTRYGIYNFYVQGSIIDLFCNSVDKGNHPEITEEIKTHFPPDFDFSGEEEEVSEQIYIHKGGKIIHPIGDYVTRVNPNEVYTQLAKEGRFDELPDTCEFSEPVELDVWDRVENKKIQIGKADVVGKFKCKFISLFINNEFTFWNFAQLPTKKIDFTQFKAGDVVEVELIDNEKRIGWFDYVDNNHVVIHVLKRKGNQVCNGGSCAGSKMLNKEKIKSITKIK